MDLKHSCPECHLIFEAELPQTGVLVCPLCSSAFTVLPPAAPVPTPMPSPPATSGRQVLRGVVAVGAVFFLAGGLGYAYYLMGGIIHQPAVVPEPEAAPPPPTVSPKPVEIFPTFRLAKPQPRTPVPQADPPSRPTTLRPAVIPTLPQLVETPPVKPAEPRLQSLAPEFDSPKLPSVVIPTLSHPAETSPVKLAEGGLRAFVPRPEPSFQPPKRQVVLPKETRPLTLAERVHRGIDRGFAYLRARHAQLTPYRKCLALLGSTLLEGGILANGPSSRQIVASPARLRPDVSGPIILQGQDAFLAPTGKPLDPTVSPGPIILQGPDAYLGQSGKPIGSSAAPGPIILQGADAFLEPAGKSKGPSAPPDRSMTRSPSTK